MILTLKGADFSASNIGALNGYTVSINGTGIIYSGPSYVEKNATLSGTITLQSGYTLTSATVTMGGNTVTSGVTVGTDTVTLNITNVTGNVIVTVVTVGSSTGGGEEELPSTLTLYGTTPSAGLFIMDYQSVFAIQSNTTSVSGEFEIIAVDVSNYIGKTLNITATQAVISEAYYSFFTNALAGSYNIETLASLTQSSLPETASAGRKHTLNSSMIIEKFVVSASDKKTNTIQKVVPSSAKYLYFTNLPQKQTAEPAVTLA